MSVTRDQRRKQAAYTTMCREKKRTELLRQAVSAELRRAAKESLATPAGAGTGVFGVRGREWGLGELEYRFAACVRTNLKHGLNTIELFACPVMKGDRRIDTRYGITTGGEIKTFLSGFRGAIAAELIASGVVLRSPK